MFIEYILTLIWVQEYFVFYPNPSHGYSSQILKMLCGDVDGDSSDDFEFSDGDNTKQDQKESNAYGLPTSG